jgi:hypothetical protein
MSDNDTKRPCAVCGDPVDPLDAHWLHLEDCVEGCDCDAVVHGDCCPDPACAEVEA